MTTLTLSAGLDEARERKEAQRPSIDSVVTSTPVEEMDDHALLEATRTGWPDCAAAELERVP